MNYLIFLLLFGYVCAKPKECCKEGEVITHNRTCSDGERLLTHEICTLGSYMVPKGSEDGDDYHVTTDGIILEYKEFDKVIYETDKYCVGKLEEHNNSVALICFDDIPNFELETNWQYIVRIVCCLTSVTFLLITLIVYIILPNLRDLQGKCLMSSIFSLMLSFLFLSTVQLQTTQYSITTCVALAFLIYFCFICAFTWLNVVSINLMLSVINPKWFVNAKNVFMLYSIYGWGLPIIFLVVTLITHHAPGNHINPRFGEGRCWFYSDKETWAFFYGPITILLLSNLIMFIITIWVLVKNEHLFAATKLRSHKFKCMLYMKLFFIMGVLWLFEPLSAIPSISDWKVWIGTDILNSLQGILIFLLLVVFRNRVRRDLGRKGIICCRFMESWTTIKEEDCEELEEEQKNDNGVSQVVNSVS